MHPCIYIFGEVCSCGTLRPGLYMKQLGTQAQKSPIMRAYLYEWNAVRSLSWYPQSIRRRGPPFSCIENGIWFQSASGRKKSVVDYATAWWYLCMPSASTDAGIGFLAAQFQVSYLKYCVWFRRNVWFMHGPQQQLCTVAAFLLEKWEVLLSRARGIQSNSIFEVFFSWILVDGFSGVLGVVCVWLCSDLAIFFWLFLSFILNNLNNISFLLSMDRLVLDLRIVQSPPMELELWKSVSYEINTCIYIIRNCSIQSNCCIVRPKKIYYFFITWSKCFQISLDPCMPLAIKSNMELWPIASWNISKHVTYPVRGYSNPE